MDNIPEVLIELRDIYENADDDDIAIIEIYISKLKKKRANNFKLVEQVELDEKYSDKPIRKPLVRIKKSNDELK